MEQEHNNSTRLKDIDEELKAVIVRLLEKSDILHITGDYINAYRAVKQVFYKIMPFDFSFKDDLLNITSEIDNYIENVGEKAINLSVQFEINKRKIKLKSLIDYYFQLIPHCLKELNLYLKVIRIVDDPDEQFSQETFTTDTSLIEDKKKELIKLSAEELIGFMTPRQIHDAHSRYLVKKVRQV